jgi:hypothetical protein
MVPPAAPLSPAPPRTDPRRSSGSHAADVSDMEIPTFIRRQMD